MGQEDGYQPGLLIIKSELGHLHLDEGSFFAATKTTKTPQRYGEAEKKII
jgi:hypothetical protein